MLLIVGSNGLLGRYAAAYFSLSDDGVVLASHQPGADLHIDLRMPSTDLVPTLPAGITHALICSSVTDVDACRQDPEGTGLLNVTNTISLIESLVQAEIQPIFCSSDLVFQGDRGSYREDDDRSPTTEYGRQKKEVEDFLLQQPAPFLIIRMSKLYTLESDDPSPIGQMIGSLNEGKSIRCATDQIICPTWVGDIPPALGALLQGNATGFYHVSAPVRYTRFSLGMRVAEPISLGHLVERCSIRDFDFAEPRPTDNSLDMTKFLNETGFTFSDLEENLPKILAKHGHQQLVGHGDSV